MTEIYNIIGLYVLFMHLIIFLWSLIFTKPLLQLDYSFGNLMQVTHIFSQWDSFFCHKKMVILPLRLNVWNTYLPLFLLVFDVKSFV